MEPKHLKTCIYFYQSLICETRTIGVMTSDPFAVNG